MSNQILVIKWTNTNTTTYFRPDQEYDDDPLIEAVAVLARTQNGEPTPDLTIDSAAYCNPDLLNIEGTNIDDDITIVDGVVINSNAP